MAQRLSRSHAPAGMATAAPRLGLLANWQQFTLLALINVFVGGMVGLERTVVPLIGEQEFGLTSKTAIVSFSVSFGVTKALCNLFAARLSETWGRKKVNSLLVLLPNIPIEGALAIRPVPRVERPDDTRKLVPVGGTFAVLTDTDAQQPLCPPALRDDATQTLIMPSCLAGNAHSTPLDPLYSA